MKRFSIYTICLLFVACYQPKKEIKLATTHFIYSAYRWYTQADTSMFYLAHYLEIDQNGHYRIMRHERYMDSARFFTGDIPDTARQAINAFIKKNSSAKDYLSIPEDSFIYDGFTYCFDYKKQDSADFHFQFIPPKSPDDINQLRKLLDNLIFVWAAKDTSHFELTDYSMLLSHRSVYTPTPEKVKPIIIK